MIFGSFRCTQEQSSLEDGLVLYFSLVKATGAYYSNKGFFIESDNGGFYDICDSFLFFPFEVANCEPFLSFAFEVDDEEDENRLHNFDNTPYFFSELQIAYLYCV